MRRLIVTEVLAGAYGINGLEQDEVGAVLASRTSSRPRAQVT